MNNCILLFDGECNLCNRTVQFVIKRDWHHQFRFASLQGVMGTKFIKENGMFEPGKDYRSAILIKNGKIYTRSSAILHVARELSGWWPLLFTLIIIPKFVRDACYSLIARYRSSLFGKAEQCWLPAKNLDGIFIE